MSVTGTSSVTNTTSATTSSSTESSSTLDKNAFLKLMCTQLQNQDPLSPMKDTEYISQMASFSSLEQMENLNSSFTTLSDSITSDLIPALTIQQASSLVGKTVTYTDSDDVEQSGTVDSIVLSNGSLSYYVVDGQQISPDNLVTIGSNQDDTESTLEKILAQVKQLNQDQTQEEG